MLMRTAPRLFLRATPKTFLQASAVRREQVMDCVVTHGCTNFPFRFCSHPGVMAISALLEMQNVCRMRANFSQDNIEAIKEFDEELARQAQIAYDHGLAIGFIDMERIEENLPRLLQEKAQLEAARKEILMRAVGDYKPIGADVSAFKPETMKFKMPDSYREQLDR